MTHNIESRLLRLERFLEQLGTVSRVAPGDSVDLAALTRLRALAPRLELLTAEVCSRGRSAEWDSADALAARLLLTDLTEAVRAYRTVTTAANRRIGRADAAIHDVNVILESRPPEGE